MLDHSKIDLLKTFKVRYSSVYSIEWFTWMLIGGSRLMLVATECQLLPTCDVSGRLHYF